MPPGSLLTDCLLVATGDCPKSFNEVRGLLFASLLLASLASLSLNANLAQSCIPSRPVPQPMLDILLNPHAIAIDQQWAGHGGDYISNIGPVAVWAKRLPAGGVGVVLFRNQSKYTQISPLRVISGVNLTDCWVQ